MRKANIYLGNLLSVKPEDEDQETLEESLLVIDCLQNFSNLGKYDLNFLASFLLLVSRLCN